MRVAHTLQSNAVVTDRAEARRSAAAQTDAINALRRPS
jgi:hypothetical protein